MNDSSLIVGLDIGTTKLAACAGRLDEGGIDVVAVAESPTIGVRKGMVTNIEETVSAISTTLEQVEQRAGAAAVGVVAGIGGVEITTMESKGVVAVARPDTEITDDDASRAIEAAKSVTLPANREVLHALPMYFTTDHDERLHHPVGLKSIRLEVSAQLILVSSLALKNVQRAVSQAGLELIDVVFNPLAAAQAVLSQRQIESGVLLMDLGAATTDIAIFEEGQLVHAAVLPIGSQHITNDLAIGIRTNLELAEQLKRQVGHALPSAVKASELIRLSEFDEAERETVKRQYVAQIIKARLDELFGMVNDRLKALSREGQLPAGVVLVGNGVRLEGLVEYAKETLRLPAALGRPKVVLPTTPVDTPGEPDYTTSAGLLLWGFEHGPSPRAPLPSLPGMPTVNVGDMLDKARELFKQFLP